jgi:DNA-binding CsgD family transcriptional regulator
MAEGRLTVRIRISDPEQADEIAAFLIEERGYGVVAEGGLEAADPCNVVVSDGALVDAATPHVMLREPRSENGAQQHASNIVAVLRDGSSPNIVAAAVALAGAAYRITGGRDPGDDPSDRAHLTAREEEVLALLAEGAANKVIARRLDISVHTAKFHVAAIIAKLGAVNRTDAIGIAMREGLVHL